jgi:hypothetical protein
MTVLLVILTAVVYGLLMKYVLSNIFVTRRKTVMAAEGKMAAEKSSELVPVYER